MPTKAIERIQDFTFEKTGSGWNIFWLRWCEDNPLILFEKKYLGECHRDKNKWASHHIPISNKIRFASRMDCALYLKEQMVAHGPRCPQCGKYEVMGHEYSYNEPQHYDGVSEWVCPACNIRWGRWSGKLLADGEYERRFGR
jgi:hypothetical protein